LLDYEFASFVLYNSLYLCEVNIWRCLREADLFGTPCATTNVQQDINRVDSSGWIIQWVLLLVLFLVWASFFH